MSAEFVAHMEDVLDGEPVVCFDETSTQFGGDSAPTAA